MSSNVEIASTFGSLLIGALLASFLSGGVTIQTLVYYKLYPTDGSSIKTLVFAIWLLDTCHTGLIWGSQWEYFIGFYGMDEKIDYIPTTLALSIAITGILTVLVHAFFAHRIFLLSKRKWSLVVPVVIIAVLRLVSSTATTATMLHYRSFVQFRQHVRWLFTLGLALSSAVDVLITSSLFFLLRSSKREGGSLDGVIDALILYTFETGSVTCAATIVSMICWITIPTQLIFMALHFIIGKFYATSLLVTLNTRRVLRDVHSRGSSSGRERGAFVLDNHRMNRISKDEVGSNNGYDGGKGVATELQINVERSVQYTRDSY
ncbi:hypothetical protein DFJ43DRAFT_78677 [Lentinula guzmanii]|uniref:DUF6534 domain-containing protein n=2 Tax=Lentinula TaxID=5352 RepID=A0AA38JED0_9AGAR|nr:hypothetical protein DFJ43DRAFT_78677 [Lentinula guzmanii]KAJ3783082.1 hypothetical protein GGU10DRAFT_436176 [Lentinula aff. detonsa]